MSVLVVNCPDSSIKSFSNSIKKEIAVHKQTSGVCVVSVEEARLKRKNSVVVGRLVKHISVYNETQPFVVIFKEISCNGSHGSCFTAIIHNQVSAEFKNLKPECGDLIAFFEPFIFKNPALTKDNCHFRKLTLHVLEIGHSLIVCAKKTMLSPQINISSKKCEIGIKSEKKTSPTTHSNANELIMQEDLNIQERKKPSIQLPVNPQIPGNTKRLNPQYKYTTIMQVKSSARSGNLERANMFVVVKDITKTISKTPSGKFTIICKVIDDSINKKEITCQEVDKKLFFFIHFFTADDSIIKQIECGDILRLHRVQVEIFNDDVDGRVFNSHDIMLFKSNLSDIRPVTLAKKTVFTEDDKKRVNHLRNWLNGKLVLLENIRHEGVFSINCKVIAEPIVVDKKVILKVSDGSDTRHFCASFPLKRSHTNHVATVIEISQSREEFLKLNSGDFVHFNNLKASFKDGSKLYLYNPSVPYYLDETSNEILNLKRKTDYIEVQNKNDNTKQETATPHCNNEDCIKSFTSPSNSHKMTACKNKQTVDQLFWNKDDVNNGLKPRKTLFSANYGDLSDATEEDTMEVLEALNNSDENQEIQLQEDVTPANTSFGDLMELVKTKYCSPRKISSFEGDQLKCLKIRNFSKRDIHEHSTVSDKVLGRDTRLRKRTLNATGVKNHEECVDDDSTVINMSIQNNLLNTEAVKNKKIRLESKSTATDGELINIQRSSELSSMHTSDSVLNWLCHPNNKHINQIRNLAETEDIDITEIIHLLDGEFCKTPDFSHYLNTNINRCQFFLIEVVPDPSKEPLDLVSGFCNLGCQKFFLFSTIKWDFNEESIPFCPLCININQERELELLFLIELHVMTTLGLHDTVIACRENAEVFLGCTAKEFVTDSAVRMSRVQMLNEYTLVNTINSARTPLMDISVILKDQILCLVNSKLKHPSIV